MAEYEAPNQSGGYSERSYDYQARAAEACEAGDYVLGMHLYLAAYEKAVADPDIPDGMALGGLREAWNLACDLKERSMAEYVFEKLEPYLTADEIAECAQSLQSMALDRLEEYGFSREDLEDMAEMITQDLADGEGSVVKVESISIPNAGMFGVPGPVQVSQQGEAAGNRSEPAHVEADESKAERGERGIGMEVADVNDFNPYDEYRDYSIGKSYHAATNEGSGAAVFTRDPDRLAASERAAAESADEAKSAPEPVPAQRPAAAAGQGGDDAPEPAKAPAASLVPARNERPSAPAKSGDTPKMPQTRDVPAPALSYRNLAGYAEVVGVMRNLGLGMQNDRAFRDFIGMLNERHGLDRPPAFDTLLFRSDSIEDATRFVDATVGEIGLPVLRMSMEYGIQGAPMLCVSTFGNNRPRMNHAHNQFESPAILIIDDLDQWIMPQMPEGMEGFGGFVMANISRGAREAVNLIRSAVEDPDVLVLVTATTYGEPDPFFYEMLEPLTVIDIEPPNDRERVDIWNEVARDHPSMRLLSRRDLVRYSAGLSRYDLYMAARDAIEDAYKAGVASRTFVPVTADNIFEKLAACHPVDSDEYRSLEDKVVDVFSQGLDDLEGLLDDSGR